MSGAAGGRRQTQRAAATGSAHTPITPSLWRKNLYLFIFEIVSGVEPLQALVDSLEGPAKHKEAKRVWELADVFNKMPLSERSVRSHLHLAANTFGAKFCADAAAAAAADFVAAFDCSAVSGAAPPRQLGGLLRASSSCIAAT